jgi:hypothetical protein
MTAAAITTAAAAARWAAAGLAAELAALPERAVAEQVLALAMAGPALGWPPAWRRRHDLAALELARRALARRPGREARR